LIVTGVVPSVYVILHGWVPVKATDKLVDPPVQIEALPLRVAVGKVLTVTTALPVKEVPMQLASLTAVSEYVFVLRGETGITTGLAPMPLIVTGVVPSVYVILHGETPVKLTDKLVDPPAQIEAVPLITAVGDGITVTTGLPVKVVPVQLASLTDVMV
jgi:hypothetical protein